MLTGSYIKPSKEECLSFCNEVCIETPYGPCIPSCEWFSFDQNQKVCLHFNSCPEIDETFTEYISGQKDCYQEPLCKFSIREYSQFKKSSLPSYKICLFVLSLKFKCQILVLVFARK